MLQGWGAKGTLVYCWGEHTLVQTLEKIVWRLLRKLKLDVPYDPVNALQDISKNKTKTLTQKDTWTPKFMAALFIIMQIIAKLRKQSEWPSTDEWIKMWHPHTLKNNWAIKNGILPFVTTWMNWRVIMLSEIHQTEKAWVISLTCGI